MKAKLKSLACLVGAVAPFFIVNLAQAKGRLTVYCTVQNEVCENITQKFAKKYDVQTQFIQGGTGTIFSKIKAEKDNPQADVWFGGTIEPHFQAGELGLLESYRSPKQAEILPQFKQLIEKKGEKTSIIYMLVLGFGTNTEKLQKLGLTTPKTWNDLLDPKYKGEIQLPDPRTSGTAYTIMTSLIQTMGEEKAFEYLKKLNENVSQYAKSNLVTANLARGESAVSVGFIHAYATEKDKGAPVETVIPDGKVSYELGGASIIKNARNVDNAKLFMDYVLSAEAQEVPWRENGVYQIPTNVNAQVSQKSVDPKKLDLLQLDFEKFGNKEEGKRLIDKWLAEIKIDK